MDFIKKYAKPLIGAVVVLVLIIVGFSIYGSINGTRGQAITKENQLVAAYQDNQNELSTYILQFNETLGIADKQSDVLNDIILNAVQGRYDNDGSLQPGTGGTMFSAIAEAYPDLTATTETYAKVQDLVIAGRNAFKNKQTHLLDLIRDYNTWRESDLFRSFLLKNIIGAPTDNLKVTVGDDTYRGEEALDKISQIILTDEAADAYETGTQGPLITPKSTE